MKQCLGPVDIRHEEAAWMLERWSLSWVNVGTHEINNAHYNMMVVY